MSNESNAKAAEQYVRDLRAKGYSRRQIAMELGLTNDGAAEELLEAIRNGTISLDPRDTWYVMGKKLGIAPFSAQYLFRKLVRLGYISQS